MPSEELSNRPQGPAIHVIALVLVALGSSAIGYFLVLCTSAPAETADRRGSDAAVAAPVSGDDGGSPEADGGEPEPSPTTADPLEGLLVRPSPRIEIGEPSTVRCWDAGKQAPLQGDDCDRLRPLERVVASRLGAVVTCLERLDRSTDKGVLSLAMDIDFGPTEQGKAGREGKEGKGKVVLWSGKATTLESPEAIVGCMKKELEDLPLEGIRHSRQKYTVFVPIELGRTKEGETGTPVQIVLERVRLREEPETGKIIARLERGEPVVVIERREGWLRTRTADGRVGWVFTDAVTLGEP